MEPSVDYWLRETKQAARSPTITITQTGNIRRLRTAVSQLGSVGVARLRVNVPSPSPNPTTELSGHVRRPRTGQTVCILCAPPVADGRFRSRRKGSVNVFHVPRSVERALLDCDPPLAYPLLIDPGFATGSWCNRSPAFVGVQGLFTLWTVERFCVVPI